MKTPQRQRRAKALREYKKARDEQLAEFPNCQIRAPGCTGRATEVSHIIGRARGGALADRKNMKSACHNCGQYVEHNKAWALAEGHHKHAWEERP